MLNGSIYIAVSGEVYLFIVHKLFFYEITSSHLCANIFHPSLRGSKRYQNVWVITTLRLSLQIIYVSSALNGK